MGCSFALSFSLELKPGAFTMPSIDTLAKNPYVTARTKGSLNLDGTCVIYWMQRSQRAGDNAALNIAVAAANALSKPVVVFFGLRGSAYHANYRHYHFMLQGLADVAAGLRKRGVGFVLRRHPEHDIARFCAQVRPCLVISDEDPLRRAEEGRTRAARELAAPFWTVDADVIVPSRLLGKEHYAARTIRPRIHKELPRLLRRIADVRVKVRWQARSGLQCLDLDHKLLTALPVDRTVGPANSFAGGSAAAHALLKRFVTERLRGYARKRNQPDIDGTSQLSPYLHFGHIGPHTVAMAVQQAVAPAEDRKAFLEELIVRRELAVNFVRYNSRYDSCDACEPWAEATLRRHLADRRSYIYTERELERAATHDPLWNAAQKQMVLTGWMHGYLRMYWAKKILEWSASPAEAYGVAVRLNDRYELDGRDPNGYAGIAWAIAGKHDRAWGPERPVYGKIRYMSYASTSRKFDSRAYIARIEALEKGRRD
jgi:deoxyribodipyrimidine photo-lyase